VIACRSNERSETTGEESLRKAPQNKVSDTGHGKPPGVDEPDHVVEALKPGLTDEETKALCRRLEGIRSPDFDGERAPNDFFYAGLKEPEVVKFLTELKDAVAKNDRAKVGSMVKYPTEIRLDGEGDIVEVKNVAEFVQKYDAIMTSRVLQDIGKAEVSNVRANWQGVSIGRGSVWFGGICEDRTCGEYKMKITRSNNHPISGAPPKGN
jgi:hypothetical protein